MRKAMALSRSGEDAGLRGYQPLHRLANALDRLQQAEPDIAVIRVAEQRAWEDENPRFRQQRLAELRRRAAAFSTLAYT